MNKSKLKEDIYIYRADEGCHFVDDENTNFGNLIVWGKTFPKKIKEVKYETN